MGCILYCSAFFQVLSHLILRTTPGESEATLLSRSISVAASLRWSPSSCVLIERPGAGSVASPAGKDSFPRPKGVCLLLLLFRGQEGRVALM